MYPQLDPAAFERIASGQEEVTLSKGNGWQPTSQVQTPGTLPEPVMTAFIERGAQPEEVAPALQGATKVMEVKSLTSKFKDRTQAIEAINAQADAKQAEAYALIEKAEAGVPLERGEMLVLLGVQILSIAAGAALGGGKEGAF